MTSNNNSDRPNGRYSQKSELSLDIPSNFPPYHGSSDFIINDTPEESCVKSTSNWCKTTAKKVFSKKTLYKRLPILTWLPKYNSQDAVGDLVAGITVGLTVIPQALAYAGIANLPAAVSIILSRSQ